MEKLELTHAPKDNAQLVSESKDIIRNINAMQRKQSLISQVGEFRP